MNKLAIIVPFYKRPELTKLCFRRLLSQSKRLGVDVIVCGSEGQASKKLAKGLKYIETPNILGTKLNALLQECKDYDGVILLGSDDFISDSVIEMYQEIDVSQEVYYSFNDVYVYSNRFKKIVSDLDFTRKGHGIGVGRLFTKPTLEKMNYNLWDSKRARGMDTDSVKSLTAKGIKQELIDLDEHFVLDVKVEYNLTAQDIVNTGHKEHSISILNKHLGVVGQLILGLKSSDIEHVKSIKKKTKVMNGIKGIIVQAFGIYEEGKTYEFRKSSHRELLKAGYIKAVAEKPVKQAAVKKPAKKKTPKKK